MKKIVALVLGVGFLFAMDPQTATKEELASIKGVGEKKAEAIVEFREKHPIRSEADLMLIEGIDLKTARNIYDDVKASEAEPKKEHPAH
ncbi:ComEA family DNA-binding protein [Hydrogenimonas sp.]